MNYQGIQKSSFVNGEGARTVLWVSGCEHRCLDCQNPDTWNPDSGQEFTEETLNELLYYVSKPYIDGLTLSGGDPMHVLNRKTVTEIAMIIKETTNKSIWMYTGYKFEEIQNESILNYLDVIVDGEFVKALASESYMWAGSTNQKIWRKIDNEWKCDQIY